MNTVRALYLLLLARMCAAGLWLLRRVGNFAGAGSERAKPQAHVAWLNGAIVTGALPTADNFMTFTRPANWGDSTCSHASAQD